MVFSGIPFSRAAASVKTLKVDPGEKEASSSGMICLVCTKSVVRSGGRPSADGPYSRLTVSASTFPVPGWSIATPTATRFPGGTTVFAAFCAAAWATGLSVVWIVRPPSNSSRSRSAWVAPKRSSARSVRRTYPQKNGTEDN